MRNFMILVSLTISSQSLAISPVSPGSISDSKHTYTNASLVDKAINDVKVRKLQNLAKQEKWRGLQNPSDRKVDARVSSSKK